MQDIPGPLEIFQLQVDGTELVNETRSEDKSGPEAVTHVISSTFSKKHSRRDLHHLNTNNGRSTSDADLRQASLEEGGQIETIIPWLFGQLQVQSSVEQEERKERKKRRGEGVRTGAVRDKEKTRN